MDPYGTPDFSARKIV